MEFHALDWLIEAILVVMLIFMPLAFGTVEAWSEMVVIILADVLAVVMVLRYLLHGNHINIGFGMFTVVFLFLLLVTFQMIPLPTEQLEWISRPTVVVKTKLLSDLPYSGSPLKFMTISFYTWATRHDFRMILVITTIFFAVITTYCSPKSIKRLLFEISLIGGCIAILALTQDLFGNNKIYWMIPSSSCGMSGPFVNHSHYGQFMNLSIGAAFALILLMLHERFYHHHFVSASTVIEKIFSSRMIGFWLLIGMIIISAATIVVSLTRGGMFSMLIAGSITAILMARKRRLKSRNWLMVLITLGVFFCILYTGFESVYDRFASLQNKDDYIGRWQIVKDVTECVERFPIWGTGMGTHRVVFPMFDRSTISALAGHAENEYAQLAEETGIIGLALAVVFVINIFRCYFYSIRNLQLPIHAAAFGLGFGLIAVLIHSLSDFGQHIPANACLSAISCGLLVNISRIDRPVRSRLSMFISPMIFRLFAFIVLIIILGISYWSITSANNARIAERYWQDALAIENDIRKVNWIADNDAYRNLISCAQKAAATEPDNVFYRHWLNVYRWKAISRITDPETRDVIVTPQTIEFTERIVKELYETCFLCPTFGPTYSLAGQLDVFILDHLDSKRFIRRGQLLAPCDANACFAVGLLEAIEGQYNKSYYYFERSLKLDKRNFQDVAEVYIYRVNRPDLALDLARGDLQRLLLISQMFQMNPDLKELAEEAKQLALTKLESESKKSNASAQTLITLASFYNNKKQYKAAVDCYRKALAKDYSRVDWRYQMAQMLAQNGETAEAIRQANICLRLSPQMTSAKKLIEDICTRSDAMKD
jgi:tetratricopeptide (TPR) repeat protein